MLSSIVTFIILLSISAYFAHKAKTHGEAGICVYTLSRVPAICAFSGLCVWLVAFILYFSSFLEPNRMVKAVLAGVFLLSPLVLLATAFAFYLRRARKDGLSIRASVASFFAGLVFSGAILVCAVIAHGLYLYNVWYSGDIVDGAKIEMNRIFTMCPEFERRIVFKSGKKVEIEIDPCGCGKFRVYRLPNSEILLKCTSDNGFSYILNTSNETAIQAREPIEEDEASEIGTLYYTEFTALKKGK